MQSPRRDASSPKIVVSRDSDSFARSESDPASKEDLDAYLLAIDHEISMGLSGVQTSWRKVIIEIFEGEGRGLSSGRGLYVVARLTKQGELCETVAEASTEACE